MDLSGYYKINRPVVVDEIIDDEAVIIHFDRGNYYSLNKVGADIWSFIESGATVSEIAEAVSHRYEGSRAIIENGVGQLIVELQEEDLIVPDKAKGPASVQGLGVHLEPDPETERPDFEAPILRKYTDMQDLLLLDPIHEVDEAGWPGVKADRSDENE